MHNNRTKREFMMGNGAIARGLLAAGCNVATSYPGTPSTEILEEIVRCKKRDGLDVYTEWSVNEKIAFDIAYAASLTGKRAAVSMKQVGLNVASDSLLSAAYTGIAGALVVISCDDPGPHSSQTEQDTRLFSIFAKVPALDPSTPQEAFEMARYALDLSERWHIPVILRPVTRLCHGSAAVEVAVGANDRRPARFKKDRGRWAATPKHRLKLHGELEEKLNGIREEFEAEGKFNYILDADADSPLGIICSGFSYATVYDLLKESGLRIPVLKIATTHPLPLARVEEFVSRFSKVLVVEEPDRAVEIQIRDRRNILGRETGHIPPSGELLPDVIYESLRNAMADAGCSQRLQKRDAFPLEVSFVPPTLCPGCGHRASFFSIRKAKANGIFPSDIGCYTLGLNMGAVDTCLDMGAGITIADGLSKAYAQDKSHIPIIATMGDSTFFHSGIPSLLNARVTGASFVLVILDNSVVAMTGFQTTPQSGVQVDGRKVPTVSIRKLVEACGCEFIEEIDPYRVVDFIALVKKAHEYAKANSTIAVIISKRPCSLYMPSGTKKEVTVIEDKCNACMYCLKYCECPGLKLDEDKKKVYVDHNVCTDCGVCVDCCPLNAIVEAE